MSWFAPIIAATSNLPVPPTGSKAATFIFSDIVMILLAVGGIMLALLIWILVRGPRGQKGRSRRIYKESHSHSHSAEEEDDEDDSDSTATGRRRKKRKVRRREHRGRNPTLAETGGLPEPRPPGAPPSI